MHQVFTYDVLPLEVPRRLRQLQQLQFDAFRRDKSGRRPYFPLCGIGHSVEFGEGFFYTRTEAQKWYMAWHGEWIRLSRKWHEEDDKDANFSYRYLFPGFITMEQARRQNTPRKTQPEAEAK